MGKWEISKGHSDTSYRTAEPPAEVSAAWPNHNMLQSLAQRIKTNINKMGAHPFCTPHQKEGPFLRAMRT